MTVENYDVPVGVGAVLNRISDPFGQDNSRQKPLLEEWLDRRGIRANVPEPFWIDDDGSRDLMEARAGFAKIMKLVRAEAIQWVLVPEFDRFGMKNWKHLGKYLLEFEEHGVDLWCVDRGKLTDDDLGKELQLVVGAHTSREEQRKTGHRVLTKKRQGFKDSYQGGHIPLGFDVLCIDSEGRERWRMLHRGREKVKVYDREREKFKFVYLQKRLKVYPDGRSERFDDHALDHKPYAFKNVPAKEKADRLVLGITRDQTIIDAIRAVFKTYATQAISFRELAKMLGMMAKSYYLPTFNSAQIHDMLRDEIYVGNDYGGKFSYGKHDRFHKGVYGPPKEVKGKVKRGVANPREDWVKQDYPITPIFDLKNPDDEAIWKKVQEKLAGQKERKRSVPKSERLWLSPFLICGTCGQPMRGFHMKRPDERYTAGRRDYPHYLCNSWDKDHSTCDRNTLPVKLIEAVISKYVDETGKQLALLTDAEHPATKEILMPLVAGLKTLHSTKDHLTCQMAEYVRPLRTDSETMARALRHFADAEIKPLCRTPASAAWGAPLIDFYRFFFTEQSPRLGESIAAKEIELDEMLDGLKGLKGEALQRRQRRANDLGDEITALKGRQVNLADELESLSDEINKRLEAYHRLKSGLRENCGYRRMAQDLGEIVKSITCCFEPTGKQRPKTRLAKVVIEGKDGCTWSCDAAQYRSDVSPPRSSYGLASGCRRRAFGGTQTPPARQRRPRLAGRGRNRVAIVSLTGRAAPPR